MNIESSSLLGYVFIISGIALGILAYAIYLNLREAKSNISDTELPKDSVQNDVSTVQPESVDTTNQSLSATPVEHHNDIPIEASMNQDEKDTPMPAELENGLSPKPDKQDLAEVATILREVDTGNLIIRVGSSEYTNIKDLMDSKHWSRIERLSSDLAEWLKSSQFELSPSRAPSSDSKPLDDTFTAPKSMVEEINEILERKIKTEDVDRKAIKLIEMLDGTIKVYIGVDSYPIDEVPFEDVRALIRESVSEWEGSR
jgi:hypothetical protein